MTFVFSEDYDEVTLKGEASVTLHALDCKLLFEKVKELESGDTIYFCKTLGVHKEGRSYTIVRYISRSEDTPLFSFNTQSLGEFEAKIRETFSDYF